MSISIQSTNWDGYIPCVFNLSKLDVSTYEYPLPLYILVPRMGYFSSKQLLQQINGHFQRYAPASNPSVWYEYEDIPINWAYPIGVLHDLFKVEDTPWNITIRYSAFPHELIPEYRTDKDALAQFKNSMKEALYLKYGSAQPASNLSEMHWYDIWTCIYDCKLALMQEILDTNIGDFTSIKHFPVRILTFGNESDSKIQVIRKRFSDSQSTLQEFLQAVLDNSYDFDKHEVVIQGIQVPMSTPMEWLCSNLQSGDQFVYISWILQ